jgi:hypothetical protein
MNIRTEIRDRIALEAACKELGIKILEGNSHHLYGGTEYGIGLKIPGWNYPVVVKDNGTLAFDDYKGSWGNKQDLTKLMAYYGLEKSKAEAEDQGYTVEESYNSQTQELELEITVEE